MANNCHKYITVALLSGAAAYLAVYWLRWRRWAAWRKVPANVWEQMAAEMKYGRQKPLDAAQVLADVQAWLDGGDEDDG